MNEHHRSMRQGNKSSRFRLLRCELLEDRRLLKLEAQFVHDVYPQEITEVGDIAFFTGYTAAAGRELWRTDGTAAGTRLVKDIWPGSDSYFDNFPRFLTDVNGTLFFTAQDSRGYELWKSDGTSAGTVQVKDISAYAGHPGSRPDHLINVGGTLFFRAQGREGSELWKSDGTAAGTVQVKDLHADSYEYGTGSRPHSLTNVNGTVFFASETLGGLWKSDGTAAGTIQVKERVGALAYLTNVNGTLFFRGVGNSAGDSTGWELWKSDGTAAGTVLVKDIFPGSTSTGANNSRPSQLINVNGTLFFRADRQRNTGLWKSDGTAEGTVLVKDRFFDDVAGSRYGIPAISEMTNVGGTLYFLGVSRREYALGPGLWRSDGTSAGTTLVKLVGGNMAFRELYQKRLWLTNVDGSLFFRNGPTVGDKTIGSELWKSDGTAAGTKLFQDIYPGIGRYGAPNSSHPSGLANINGTLFFAAGSPEFSGLWRVADRPTLSLGGSITYVESRAPLALARGAAVHSAHAAMPGGALSVNISQNAADGDRLRIHNAGGGPGQIGLSGASVTFGGIAIGVFSGGNFSTPLVVRLNSQASVAAVQALVREITFRNIDSNPPRALRTVRFVLDDGVGGISPVAIKYVNVQRNSAAPLIEMGGHVSFREQGPPLAISPFARVSDPDSNNFDAGKLTVELVADAVADDRLAIHHQGTSSGQIGIAGANVTYGGRVIGSFSGGAGENALEVSLNVRATRAAVHALVRSITYRNTGDDPIAGVRSLRFRLEDGDGGAATVIKPLYILRVNDPPVLTLGGSREYVHDAPAFLLAPAATLVDVDSSTLVGGRLTIRITEGRSPDNWLSLGNGFSETQRYLIFDRDIIGRRIGTGSPGNDLIFELYSLATVDLVEQLVRSIRFRTIGGVAGTRVVEFAVSDGDGGTSAVKSITVNVR